MSDTSLCVRQLNVKKVEFIKGEAERVEFDFELNDDLRQEGEMRVIIRKIQAERKNLGTDRSELVEVTLPSWPKNWEDEIKNKALVHTLTEGDFKVTRVTTV